MSTVETPCFIIDKEEFDRSYQGFKAALSSHFKSNIVGYSVKTNSLPYCLKRINKLGGYAEVVSHDEYNLALTCGFSKDHIIYNGPMKSKATFLDAIKNRAFVNIETKRELRWLCELPEDKHYQVGIRLNINITTVSEKDADGANDNSRFGFSDETSEFMDAISFIRKLPQIELTGLHIHRTTHSRSVNFYRQSIRYASSIIKKYGMKLTYLDVGGGYFGIFANKPSYADYCNAFSQVLKEENLSNLTLIVEPGNALVASAFTFVSEVIDVKHTESSTYFITTDGSRNDIDPFFKKTNYIKEIHHKERNETKEVELQIISGCTCLEYDRMFTLENERLLQEGDRVIYHNVGAYTLTLSPLFIRYIPNVYTLESGEYKLVRKKWTEKEFIANNI